MNWPWTKWFWRDWLADGDLGQVSAKARGVWMEMLCIMAQGRRYGYLETAAGKPMSDEAICRLGRLSSTELSEGMQELLDAKVPGLELSTGILYSRRLVREDEQRTSGRKFGKKGGGNPLLREESEENPDTRLPDTIGSKGVPKGPLYTPPIKGAEETPAWTLQDFTKAAQAIGMKPADVEACFHNYAACGFIDAAGRKITSIPSLLAKWKAKQPSRGKSEPRQQGGSFRGPPIDGPSEEWTRAYADIADQIWRAKESGEGGDAIKRAMQKARDAYNDVPRHKGKHVVDAAIEMAMNNRRPE